MFSGAIRDWRGLNEGPLVPVVLEGQGGMEILEVIKCNLVRDVLRMIRMQGLLEGHGLIEGTV